MLYFIENITTDPYFNLAMEEYIFENLPRENSYMFLWQNDNAIIVGRYQNTYAEINNDVVSARNIRVVRRLSGGGAVYHDKGNLNYSLIVDAERCDSLDFKRFNNLVAAALRKLEVMVDCNGRNDLTVCGKKFSGSAQYVKGKRVLHHGTLLINSDLTVLSEALKADPNKYEGKGIKSVRDRVCNLSEYLPAGIGVKEIRKRLIEEFKKGQEVKEYCFSQKELDCVQQIMKEKYLKWEWNFGSSPDFQVCKTTRIPDVGTVNAKMNVSKGTINSIELTGDFFSLDDPAKLAEQMQGCKLDASELLDRFRDLQIDKYISGITAQQLTDFLIS